MCDMGEFKIGDIVARKSYEYDVFFKIVDIVKSENESIVKIKGISYRIEADAPESDLVLQPEHKVNEYRDKCMRSAEIKANNNTYASRHRGYSKKAYYRNTPKDEPDKIRKPGKVLHIDGDKEYMETCLSEYKKLGMTVFCEFVTERDQPACVLELLHKYRPDILVLTGHDGFIKGNDSYSDINSYRNTRYFIDAVKEARSYERDLDSLVIFAGACQSLYYELIKAGANFASSPFRELIHALDPVRVCQKIAFTSVEKVVTPEEVIENTITGKSGIGGMQTRGKYREGFPLEPFQQIIL